LLPDLSRLLFFQRNIKLIRCSVATVKKTTSKKATTTRKASGPTITAYKTLTTARTTVKMTAKPISTYIDDNGDDSGDGSGNDTDDDVDTSTDGGSRDDSYFGFGGCDQRQIFGLNPLTTIDYYNPDDPQPTSYGGDWGEWSGWGEATTTTDDWGDDIVTTTVHTSSRHRHTTMAYPPRVTWWSKPDAAPQSDDEFDFTSFDTEIEEPEEVDILKIGETDNKKWNALLQTKFSVTLDLDYPIKPFDGESYIPTGAPSKTTDGGPFGPYGSWYPIATTSRKYPFASTTYKSPVATTTHRYPGITATRKSWHNNYPQVPHRNT
jgi:hypothetical protein